MSRFFAAAALLYVFSALQDGLAPKLAILNATPDFGIVAICSLAPFLSRYSGTIFGFFFGLFFGSLAGANSTQNVVAKSALGYFSASSGDFGIEPSIFYGFVCAAIGTILHEIIFMFLAPPPNLAAYLGATILTATYNGVLVVPLYALFKKLLRPVR